MNRARFIILAAGIPALTPACTGEPATTTVVTTVVTTATASEGDATEGATDTDAITSSTSTGEQTTGEPVNTTEDEPTTTDGPPPYAECVDEVAYPCEQAPTARSFCGYVAQTCVEREIESVYCDLVNSMCEAELPACEVCFNLSNICSQTGTSCGNLFNECGCVADATGAL